MVFSDLFFIFVFIPAFVVIYLVATFLDKRVLPKKKAPLYYEESDVPRSSSRIPAFHARNTALVIFSLVFYAWGEPVYIFLMLVCVFINYLAGLGIARSLYKSRMGWSGAKGWMWFGILMDICMLGTFKYLGFFNDTLALFGLELGAPRLALPIGISFYIFQSISYLADVYRREAPVQRRYWNLLLYISMFPQLIAGPIVRYDKVAHEINRRYISSEDLAQGIYRFFIGLGKKVVLANILSEVVAACLEQSVDTMSTLGAWIGLLAFALQIYFDFSGYSDMAIGMGRAMGFHFNENFNHPYCATSVTDFWRRWHISLGSFFRDYAYIPLGGNRRHQMLNLLTVWFLTGMWHGASWNFIFWGLYFGFILVIEKYALLPMKRWIPTFLMRIWALMVVLVGWALFYFDNFDKMKSWFGIATGSGLTELSLIEQTALTDNFWIWVVALIFCMPVRSVVENFADRHFSNRGAQYLLASVRATVSVLILILCAALLVGATNNAFIYTRF